MSKYAWVLFFSGIVPFLVSFWPSLMFWAKAKALAATIVLIVIIFGGWDVFATWRGHWSFDPAGVSALKIINLPLEEFLFFVIIPFCCVFTWEVMGYMGKRK